MARTNDGNHISRYDTIRLLRDVPVIGYRAGSVFLQAAHVSPPPGVGGWSGWYVRVAPDAPEITLQEGHDAELVTAGQERS